MTDDELIAHALQIATRKITERDEEVNSLIIENAALLAQNRELMKKATYFDEFVDSKDYTGIRQTAKLMNIKEKQLTDYIITKRFAYRDSKNRILAYAAKNRGYFLHKEVRNDNSGWHGVQLMFTPKGRSYFDKKINHDME